MREKIIAGNLYHILNRGVDKRKIFMDNEDYMRFIHDLFEFNDIEPVPNLARLVRNNKNNQLFDVGRRTIRISERKPRKLLVEILAFCLMPNHYHLLLRPKKDNNISEFIKKLNGGYAKYFNCRYQRSGALFQGKYKSVGIKNEAHFVHIPYYIHCNPLDLIMPSWREKQITDYKKTIRFLENYRWNSYLDYIGKKNFSSVIQREFLSEFFGGPAQYKKDTIKWLKDLDVDDIKELTLE